MLAADAYTASAPPPMISLRAVCMRNAERVIPRCRAASAVALVICSSPVTLRRPLASPGAQERHRHEICAASVRLAHLLKAPNFRDLPRFGNLISLKVKNDCLAGVRKEVLLVVRRRKTTWNVRKPDPVGTAGVFSTTPMKCVIVSFLSVAPLHARLQAVGCRVSLRIRYLPFQPTASSTSRTIPIGETLHPFLNLC